MGVLRGLAAAMAVALFASAASACDLHAPDAGKAGKGCAQAWMDRNLHLNDLMTVGTHNSWAFTVRTPDKIMALIRARRARLWTRPRLLPPATAGPAGRRHARGAELDLGFYDPARAAASPTRPG